jgi:single-stranded-DNA-specific exonuclease
VLKESVLLGLERVMVAWIDPKPIEVPRGVIESVSDAGEYAPLIGQLLVQRGIVDGATARAFLDPAAYDPAPAAALPDIVPAVDRLVRAIAQGERIAVWGDFDVDGQTATALSVQALRSVGGKAVYHIPTRRESHGVHPLGVQRLIDEGVRLLLTVDTGIDAGPAVDLAARHGVDVIVTDHHDLPPQPVQAAAVVNPKWLSEGHPFYDLPGVGVAYQVVRALYDQLGRGSTQELLDLVALGIVADVVDVRQDVRYLLQLGLDVLRQTERLGLQALMDLARVNPATVGEEEIGFSLAPRLNALSRVGRDVDASQGVELLITDDLTRARTIATALEGLNARRKLVTRQTMEAALQQLERDRTLLDGPAIVVAGPTWDPGIVGIVAGRLAQRFNKPALVISAPEGEMARGSARSVEGVDIHAAIAAQRRLLRRSGGHPMAAGFSLPAERILEFRRGLWRTLAQMPPPTERQIEIGAYLSLPEISLDLAHAIERLAPFGPGNERPIFATRDLTVVGSVQLGRTDEHRRVMVADEAQREQEVMWWQSVDEPLPEGKFDLAYTLGAHVFAGKTSVQLTWVDARVRESTVIEVTPRPAVHIRDYRDRTDGILHLRCLVAEAGAEVVVWGEASDPIPGIGLVDRTELENAQTLVIWTIPPSPKAIKQALDRVQPEVVALFAIDPDVDTVKRFLERLYGLVKYALVHRDGVIRYARLAAYMAHAEKTVQTGLDYLIQRGYISRSKLDHGRWVLRSPGEPGANLKQARERLLAELEEAAAYRSYYRRAAAERLLPVED